MYQSPAIHHRILENECMRRSGAHFVPFGPWNETDADHGCTGSAGHRPGGSSENDTERRSRPFRGKSQFMTSRTTPTVVRFKSAFSLPGFDAPQPAGEYRVDHDEVAIEGASLIAWRRVATFIHLPAISAGAATRQMVPIEPASLEAALEQDQRQS